MSRLSGFAALMLVMPMALAAQQPGTIAIGGFAQGTWFDDNTTLKRGLAGGGGDFLGLFIAQNLSLEGAWARSWTEDATPAGNDATWNPFRGRLVLGVPVLERFVPLVGLGFVRNDYDGVIDESDTGVSGLIGLKAYVTERLAFRTDLSVDRVWDAFNKGAVVGSGTVSDHTNMTLMAGLSIDLGPGRSRDLDDDGVSDPKDRCSATPLGVRVDRTGCRIDSDDDGVYEEADRCAATPAGVSVDRYGCRMDMDGDGVFDESDRCADTPRGVRIDDSGCRIDTDGDGVFEEDDRCANTVLGVRVGSDGCRVDSDGDGVFDEDDRCANSEPGSNVDEQGCLVLFVAERTSLVLEGVTFQTNSADLTDDARQVLGRVASSLVANPEIRVRVSGHTDASGLRAYNIALSQSRAESVVAYLSAQGVTTERMEALGVGPDRPVASNETEAGRSQNRRVELSRIDR